jgi:hypothetical protein
MLSEKIGGGPSRPTVGAGVDVAGVDVADMAAGASTVAGKGIEDEVGGIWPLRRNSNERNSSVSSGVMSMNGWKTQREANERKDKRMSEGHEKTGDMEGVTDDKR